jgi:hypothetical protein
MVDFSNYYNTEPNFYELQKKGPNLVKGFVGVARSSMERKKGENSSPHGAYLMAATMP